MARRRGNNQVRRGSAELPYPPCVYCGKRPGVQNEHVIARAFFDQPYPYIPQVPACHPCNQLRGDGGDRNMCVDEAYVRDRICMHERVDEHPDAKGLLAKKVLPNLHRPASDRERQELVESIQPTTMPLGPDQYLAGVWSFQFDMSRFERVMRKIVKGLYAYHFKQRMPNTYGFETLRVMDQEFFQARQAWLNANNPSPAYYVCERGAVWYRFASSRPHPLGNNWLIIFYHQFGFYVHAGPEGKDGKQTG